MSATTHRRTAVVVGASMAGLSAAAVLSSRFAQVGVLDRDQLPAGPAERRGVPQGRHAHGLLPAGLKRLEGWFPGLTDELVADGASLLDVGSDVHWYQGDGLRKRFTAGIKGPVGSRALLEHHVRRRTEALANVTLRSGAAVTGLTTTPDGATVTGVTLADGSTVGADLVVDAAARPARSCAGWASSATRSPRPRSSASTWPTPAVSCAGTPPEERPVGISPS
jgi:2-polyprenyl-6-methoxyphenol hydroxylase-like FAD-dependent oxidoreductase